MKIDWMIEEILLLSLNATEWLQRHFEAQRERLGKRAVFIFLVLLLVLFVLYAAGTANIGTLTVQRVRLRSEIR